MRWRGLSTAIRLMSVPLFPTFSGPLRPAPIWKRSPPTFSLPSGPTQKRSGPERQKHISAASRGTRRRNPHAKPAESFRSKTTCLSFPLGAGARAGKAGAGGVHPESRARPARAGARDLSALLLFLSAGLHDCGGDGAGVRKCQDEALPGPEEAEGSAGKRGLFR